MRGVVRVGAGAESEVPDPHRGGVRNVADADSVVGRLRPVFEGVQVGKIDGGGRDFPGGDVRGERAQRTAVAKTGLRHHDIVERTRILLSILGRTESQGGGGRTGLIPGRRGGRGRRCRGDRMGGIHSGRGQCQPGRRAPGGHRMSGSSSKDRARREQHERADRDDNRQYPECSSTQRRRRHSGRRLGVVV